MGKTKMLYQEKFPVGSNVRIKDRPLLEEFHRTWKYHHPLSTEQIAYGGHSDFIVRVSFYHGGDVLYNLKTAPGIWHEALLEAV
jgi:hypothetical protein